MNAKDELKMTIRMTLKTLKSMSEPSKSMTVMLLQRQATRAGLDWDEVSEGIDLD